MLNILRLDQDFDWNKFSSFNIVDDPVKFATLPSPKIVLMNDNKWFDYDRSNVDACVFWTSESLAFERADGNPIVPLTSKDFVFSSSAGPNNQHNLMYYVPSLQKVYHNTRYQKLLPKNEIFKNNLIATLGISRLHRCYIFCKLFEFNLMNQNISFAYNTICYRLMNDVTKELLGQEEMYRYVIQHKSFLPKTNVKLQLDYRRLREQENYYGFYKRKYMNAYFIPTKAYHDGSLIFISETIPHAKEFFVTEKTIKGLVSGRPFIVIGCQYFLQHLRELGFKTFSSVLDESYDEEENLQKRIDLALESSAEFINMNVLNYPSKLNEIQHICEHNRYLYFNTDWRFNQKLAIKKILNALGLC